MTFEYLNHEIVYITTNNVVFDYPKMRLSMVIKPDVTETSDLLEKQFRITFKDVIFIKADHTSFSTTERQIEFIAWGKSPINCCANGVCKLFTELYKRDWNYDMMRIKEGDNYTHYFFQNVVGNEINLLAKEVEVDEVIE